jgi:homoserine O-succinyltransferase
MPLVMDKGRIPPHWAERNKLRLAELVVNDSYRSDGVKIALINNMPDAALEDTELQFFDLLNAAAGKIPVHLRLYSLPKIPRSDRGAQHLSSFYFGITDLLNSHLDGIIMTGTEPLQSDLLDEPYWQALTGVLDWAEHHTASTVLSCLAAHAGVLYSDGIHRHTLNDKQFGVFESRKVFDHELTQGTAETIRFPHSRWNEVQEEALASCGYRILTKSAKAGVDMFVKQKKKSLFLHFQGHPEYGPQTLLKEYRRDIRRFLRKERETYPSTPEGYFDASATKLLNEFREAALANRTEEHMAAFPEAAVAGTLGNGWHSSAACVYRNWLQYLASRKADTSLAGSMARVGR